MAGMRPLRVYIAAPFVRKEEAKTAANLFRLSGFDVSSRWIELHGTDGSDVAVMKQEANNDIQDILQSDGMVVLQLEKSEGKAFEQGFLLAASQFTGMKNKIVLVSADGSRGNVFQYLDEIYSLVPTVEAAIDECKTWPGYIPIAEVLEQMEVTGGVN